MLWWQQENIFCMYLCGVCSTESFSSGQCWQSGGVIRYDNHHRSVCVVLHWIQWQGSHSTRMQLSALWLGVWQPLILFHCSVNSILRWRQENVVFCMYLCGVCSTCSFSSGQCWQPGGVIRYDNHHRSVCVLCCIEYDNRVDTAYARSYLLYGWQFGMLLILAVYVTVNVLFFYQFERFCQSSKQDCISVNGKQHFIALFLLVKWRARRTVFIITCNII